MQPTSTRVGFIGTGIMGAHLVRHLLKARYAVAVFNRTAAKLDALVQAGATRAESPRALAQHCDVVFMMVGFPADVRSVLFDDGALAAMRKGSVFCDLTTSAPALAREVHAKAKALGVLALDAPVTGGDVGARDAKLTLLVGGDAEAFKLSEPVLRLFGTPILMGGPGAGQLTKAANQVTIASCMVGVVEGLLFAHEAGLDLEVYLGAIRNGAAASRSLELYAPRLLKGDLNPGFLVKVACFRVCRNAQALTRTHMRSSTL